MTAVALIAPSGPIDPEHLESACRWLADSGVDVRLGGHVTKRKRFLAGSDAQRAEDLHWAWCDSGADIVLCARGGHGSTRLIDLLDWEAMAAAGPRVLIGSSDVTALHAAFAHRLGVYGVFGPMPVTASAMELEVIRTEILRSIRDPFAPQVFTGRVQIAGTARGQLVGGTLALVHATIGTPDLPRLAGKVLLLEDVNESPHRLDRMIVHLGRVGFLEGVAGVVLGSFHECGGTAVDTVVDALRGFLPMGTPVVSALPIGHGPRQAAVGLGSQVSISAQGCMGTDATVTIE